MSRAKAEDFLVRSRNTGIKIKKLHDDAVIPQYQTIGSVGFDLHTVEDIDIRPRYTTLARTGLAIATPPGYMLALTPRSSTFKHWKCIMPNSIGVIDQDYSGDDDEIMVPLLNMGDLRVKIEKGSRIAQGIFISVARLSFTECDSMGESRGGFGSTGVR